MLIGSKSILVLDDEFDVMNIIKLGLQKKGSFEVYGFTDPVLALEHFKTNAEHYSLVISDIRMPQMNGFELYKRLRTIDDKVEACFITAFEDYREEFKESFPELDEAKYFIRKPTAIQDLVNHVSEILG